MQGLSRSQERTRPQPLIIGTDRWDTFRPPLPGLRTERYPVAQPMAKFRSLTNDLSQHGRSDSCQSFDGAIGIEDREPCYRFALPRRRRYEGVFLRQQVDGPLLVLGF
jgi:hypothetical protein